MLMLAKVALGVSAAVAMSTAYVFHEGVIKVDVDESQQGGSHIHFWVPATAVSAGLYVVPRRDLQHALAEARPFLPVLRQLTKELKKYPNAQFVEFTDATDHVRIATVDGKIQIDVNEPGETVHVRVPIETLEDVSDHLESNAPGI
jgi:2-polyprenyl-6-methoxyphenol hydroxylase-like FAD-dependent oxidoreductase